MTQTQISYWNNQNEKRRVEESARHNLEQEKISKNEVAIRAIEAKETQRHNMMTEFLQFYHEFNQQMSGAMSMAGAMM